jgi:hypothetical protein
MSNEKYNNWTNYATWRVSWEIVDQIDIEFAVEENRKVTPEWVQTYVEWVVMDNSGGFDLRSKYAKLFLKEVNYVELANSLNEEIQERIKRNTDT